MHHGSGYDVRSDWRRPSSSRESKTNAFFEKKLGRSASPSSGPDALCFSPRTRQPRENLVFSNFALQRFARLVSFNVFRTSGPLKPTRRVPLWAVWFVGQHRSGRSRYAQRDAKSKMDLVKKLLFYNREKISPNEAVPLRMCAEEEWKCWMHGFFLRVLSLSVDFFFGIFLGAPYTGSAMHCSTWRVD
jgi:hypothetical protein